MVLLYKMFHVEHWFLKITLTALAFAFFASCGISKKRTEIQDFVIYENGMLVEKSTNLNAFIFENDLNNAPFQNFLTTTFQTTSLFNTQIKVKINNNVFRLYIYDNDDFEKYFGRNNFVEKTLENNAISTGNNSKFIAISVLSENNDDCLKPSCLLYEQTINYLKNLKKQYFLKNGR